MNQIGELVEAAYRMHSLCLRLLRKKVRARVRRPHPGDADAGLPRGKAFKEPAEP